jgi:hypothetical protein
VTAEKVQANPPDVPEGRGPRGPAWLVVDNQGSDDGDEWQPARKPPLPLLVCVANVIPVLSPCCLGFAAGRTHVLGAIAHGPSSAGQIARRPR